MPQPDYGKAFEEIKREVVESRNLVIKTDSLLKNLHAELKLLGKQQGDFRRKIWVSSATAYVLFALLCGLGAVSISGLRTSSSNAELKKAEKVASEAHLHMQEMKEERQLKETALRQAADAFRMMSALQEDERLKGIEALSKLEADKLPVLVKEMLSDKAEQLEKEIGALAFERGKQAMRRQEFAAAIPALTQFIGLKPPESEMLEASLLLGNALVQTRSNAAAVEHLQRYVSASKRGRSREFAQLLLVQALDATGARDEATKVAREALDSNPNGEFSGNFRSRLSRRVSRSEADASAAPSSPSAASTSP
jgi:tetratricopeptide (TPR) repeat protein